MINADEEQRVKDLAGSQGFALRPASRGRFWLIDRRTSALIAGGTDGLTLRAIGEGLAARTFRRVK